MTAQIYSFNGQSRKIFTQFGFRQSWEEFYVYPLVSYKDVQIETKDVILKKGKPEDYYDIWQNLWKHKESARFMMWEPTYTEEEAKDRMLRTVRFQEREKYAFLVYEKQSGKAIGFANMQEIGRGTYMEQGVALGPDYVGKGYGKQILNALVDAAFADQGEEFWSMCRVKNIASHKVQMECGFATDHYGEEETDPRTGEKFVREYNVRRKNSP
ncbi:MAG: GNAT family N-acetyltransferase [Lachnospiraceae bacterium]|nr:GNAT family N-acetyltransferase [Lachnospiraceae bacterium]